MTAITVIGHLHTPSTTEIYARRHDAITIIVDHSRMDDAGAPMRIECTDARDEEHSDAVRQAVIAYIRSGGEIEE